ncbi:hypothetical protein ACKKBF_B37160 [Auxenochlorella protothecoides x Auxenochlorella symbiontica]
MTSFWSSSQRARTFKHLVSRIRRLGFNPPPEADPDSEQRYSADEEGSGREDTPTVLTKLQKWGEYRAVGEPVGPTRFLPMKTPMSEEIMDSWSLPQPCAHPLTVARLVEGQAARGRRVGAIIDLANHECLYGADLPPGLRHIEVQLVAKVIPPRAAVDAVAAAAAAFWAERPDDYVAIHCAYGFNRTGFVLCSYLCQVHDMGVEDALAAFAAARPPGVKHPAFVAELHRRYDPAAARRSAPASDASGEEERGDEEGEAAQAGSALPPLDPASARRREERRRRAARISPGVGRVARAAAAAGQPSSPTLTTSASMESEAHSLGFGSREALRHLRHDIGVEEVQESAHARLTGLFDPEPACGLSSHALDSRDLGNCAIDGTVERALS